MNKQFKDKNIIITGGSGGIGSVLVKEFLRQGARILVLDTEDSYRAHIMTVDVSDISRTEKLAPYIEKEFNGRVDILINAAAISGPVGKLEELDLELWRKTIEVNLLGTVNMCTLVIPFMKKEKHGTIINFSGGGDAALPLYTAYSASKGAVQRFTESLAAELVDHKIYVNAVAPGPVDTPMLIGKESVSSDHVRDLILFLCSGKTKNLTGKLISAVHDDWKHIPRNLEILTTTDIYNVRRIKNTP